MTDHFHILAERLTENFNAHGQRRWIENGRPGEQTGLVAAVKPVTYQISLHEVKDVTQR
jgi:hypothetical protein